MHVFGNSLLSKIYASGQDEHFPSAQGISWLKGANQVAFFGGINYKEDFPIVYEPDARVGKRFKVTTSCRLKTKVPRESMGQAAICREGNILMFGGKHWKRPGQPATDNFYVGSFSGNYFSWDIADQIGCAPSPRFGHTFTACQTFSFVYGGLDVADYTFGHVNTHIFKFSHNVWSSFTSTLPPLAYHSSTYISQNTAVIIGGLQLVDNRMIRPGNIYILRFCPGKVQVNCINAGLYISGHNAVEQGDFLYIFGGFKAESPNADVQPSRTITRINIPQLREGNLVTESEMITPTFTSSYCIRTGINKCLIFDVTNHSVWEFQAFEPLQDDTPAEDMEVDGDIESLETDTDIVAGEMDTRTDTTDDDSLDLGSDREDDDNVNTGVQLTGVVHDTDSSSDSESDEDSDEPLFCNADDCTWNNLTTSRQIKLNWLQCRSCTDWFHDRCLQNGMCLVCAP